MSDPDWTISGIWHPEFSREDYEAALGQVYCKAEVQDGDRWIHQAILYRDRYRRCQGRWYFARRLHRLWYGVEASVSPLGQAPAHWPENHAGRGTLPEEWETWGEFWKQSEPG